MNDFNYKDSLNGIKASLFDIYENQEEQIGLEQNPEKRNARLNKFIEVKDIALLLIEGINYLYDDIEDQTIIKEKLENPKMPLETEESKILNLVENSNIEEIKEKGIEKENIEEQETIKDETEFNEEETTDENEDIKKYYLNCDVNNVNFAYVPQSLYEKIKNHKSDLEKENDSEDLEEDEENIEIEEEQDEEKSQSFIKQDTEKPRGIIVRSDQYMKLALSKHRQEGVLEEAKNYRVEEVKRKRREKQKKELEKAEVKINI